MLSAIEACIEWATNEGYCFAKEAATEYSQICHRELICDPNYFRMCYFIDKTTNKTALTIEVTGGVAEVTYNPYNITYEIVDHDHEDT